MRTRSILWTLAPLAVALGALATGAPAPDPSEIHERRAQSVTYDRHSLLLDGERIWLWSADFHYFRLPNPDLWRDPITSA